MIALAQSEFGNVTETKEAVSKTLPTLGIPDTDSVTSIVRDKQRSLIVDALLRIHQFTDARTMAKRINSQKLLRANAFAKIAKSQAQAGNVQEAKNSISEALQLVDEISSVDSLYADIASAQAEVGNFVDAQTIAERIEKNYHRATAFANIASSLARTTNKLE